MFTWFLWFQLELSPHILTAKVSLYLAMEKQGEEEGTMSHESVCEQQHELLLLLLLLLLNIHG